MNKTLNAPATHSDAPPQADRLCTEMQSKVAHELRSLPPCCTEESPEPCLKDGVLRIGSGRWLTRPGQPIAVRNQGVAMEAPGGTAPLLRRMRMAFQPDHARLCVAVVSEEAWFADAKTPFVSALSVGNMPLNVVTSKLLLAPEQMRESGFLTRIVPLEPRRSLCMTRLKRGWAVTATAARVTRIPVAAGESLDVCPEALVAWSGAMPRTVGVKVPLTTLLSPRASAPVRLQFKGEAVVWLEGCAPFQRGFLRKNA